MNPTIIGLVGEAGTGKGVVTDILTLYGFGNYSLSNTLREISNSINLPDGRENLTALGNSLREKFGSDVLARGAKQWVEQSGNSHVIIDSIRNPAEVTYLKQELGAFIIGVTMSPKKTFQLMESRQRPGDPTTWEEFLKLKAREEGEGQKESGQQLLKCLALADVTLKNEGTIADLHEATNELLISKGMFLEGYNPNKEK
jgi:dephospho-CoA kinase